MAVPDIRMSMARCSRASLNLLAANNGLIVGENYLITSETPNVHCVATSVSTYNEYYSKATVDTKFSLPTQTGNSGKYLTTNGTVASWGAVSTGGLQYFAESSGVYNSKYYSKLSPNSAETHVDFVLQPKGYGAIIAQSPDGTTMGGNARGIGAVDLQTTRESNYQVASGAISVICGGMQNSASGELAVVSGGKYNSATGKYNTVSGGYLNQSNGPSGSVIGGGTSNQASGVSNVIGGGEVNHTSNYYSSVGGGSYNTASGSYSFIGGGYYGEAGLYGSSAHASGRFSQSGDAQNLQLIARRISNSTTVFDLKLDGLSEGLQLKNYSNWVFDMRLSAMRANASTLDCYGAKRCGMIARRDSSSSTQIVLASLGNQDFIVGAFAMPAIAITADTTNGALKISITPADAIVTRWVATIDITQCGSGERFQ